MSAAEGETLDLEEVAGRVEHAVEGETVSVGEVVDAIGRRAFGPLLLIFGLIALSPVGAIPGASMVLGALIALVAGQVILHRQVPWMPRRLLRIEIDADKARRAIDRVEPWLAAIDKVVRPRWQVLLQPPARQVVALVCVVLAVLMYPLALVPFGVAFPAAAIVILALAISGRDGLLLTIGLVVSLGAFCAAGYIVL